MARCGCSGSCSCYVQGANQIDVSGNGTLDRPYIIDLNLTDIEAQLVTDLSGSFVPNPPIGAPAGVVPTRQTDGSVAWQGGGLYSTKGDLLIGTGAGTSAVLPVGADGTVPVADSTQATGVKWGKLGAGKAWTFDPLFASASSTFSAANRAVATRVTTGGATTGTVSLFVTTQSGNIAIALYRDNGSGAPGSLAKTSGSLACPAAGQQSVSLGLTMRIDTGDWLALACDNTTASFRGIVLGVNAPTWRTVSWASAPSALASNPTVSAETRAFALWST